MQAATAGGQTVYNLVITGSLLTVIPIMVAFLYPAAVLAVRTGRRKREAVTGVTRRSQPHPFRLPSTVLLDFESAPGNRKDKKGAMMPRSPTLAHRQNAAGAAAGLALAAALAACSSSSSSSAPAARRYRRGRLAAVGREQRRRDRRGAAAADHAHLVGVGAAGQAPRRGVREAVPEGQGQPGQRGHRHHRVHQAAERDQGRLRRPGHRAGRVLRAAAVRARRVARRPRR